MGQDKMMRGQLSRESFLQLPKRTQAELERRLALGDDFDVMASSGGQLDPPVPKYKAIPPPPQLDRARPDVPHSSTVDLRPSAVSSPGLDGDLKYAKFRYNQDPRVAVDRLLAGVPEGLDPELERSALEKSAPTTGAPPKTLPQESEIDRRKRELLSMAENMPSADALIKSIKDQEKITTAGAEAQSVVLGERMEALEEDYSVRKLAQDANMAAEASVRSDIEGVLVKIRDYEIDPRRAFKNTWQIVGAAIAAAAGAFAQGLHSRNIPNTALALIDRAISRDIEAQKMELSKLKLGADLGQNVLAHLIRENGSNMRSLIEAQSVGAHIAELAIQQVAATTKSRQAKAGADRLMQEMEFKRASTQYSAKVQAASSVLGAAVSEARIDATAAKEARNREITQEAIKRVDDQFGQLIESFKNLDVGNWVPGSSDAWSKKAEEILSAIPLIGEHLAVWATDSEARARVRDYISKGLITMTAIAKTYQGRSISNFDMKGFLAILPKWELALSKDEIGNGVAGLESMRRFFSRPWKEGELGSFARDTLGLDLDNMDPVQKQIYEAWLDEQGR